MSPKTNAKYQIINNKWIKSGIDIDEYLKVSGDVKTYLYAVKIDAIKSIEVILNTFNPSSLNYAIFLNIGGNVGLKISYNSRVEFEQDLVFFESLLMSR